MIDLAGRLTWVHCSSRVLVVPNSGHAAVQVESELKELESEEAAEFLASLGATESGLSSLVRTSYQQLGLRTYFTTGARLLHHRHGLGKESPTRGRNPQPIAFIGLRNPNPWQPSKASTSALLCRVKEPQPVAAVQGEHQRPAAGCAQPCQKQHVCLLQAAHGALLSSWCNPCVTGCALRPDRREGDAGVDDPSGHDCAAGSWRNTHVRCLLSIGNCMMLCTLPLLRFVG